MRCTRSPIRSAGRPQPAGARAPARAFTLIEMLVVLVIVVTLVALAAGAMRRTPADRINASARQLQSRVLLARSIAARDQRISGIRFVQSANDPWVVDSVELIASPGYDIGTLSIVSDTTFTPALWRIDNDTPGEWQRLFDRGLIRDGSRVELPAGTGRWYQLQRVAAGVGSNRAHLVGHFTPSVWSTTGGRYQPQPDPNNDGIAENIPYRLELAPSVVASEEPLRLQPGTAIDLAGCVNVPVNGEILFLPGQGLSGENAAAGNIFLYITTLQDIELTRNLPMGATTHPALASPSAYNPNIPGAPLPCVPANLSTQPGVPGVPTAEPAAIAIFAQTGNVMGVSVDLTPVSSPANLRAADPYVDARRGKELGR